jgi:hypothetical protein
MSKLQPAPTPDQVVSRARAAALHREAMESHGGRVRWVVEHGYAERAGKFVARLVTDGAPKPYVLTALSLPEMRFVLPRGLMSVPRRSADGPFLVETWFPDFRGLAGDANSRDRAHAGRGRMTNAEIEDRLTELMARSDAQNVILHALAVQFAANALDWRDGLDTIRMTAEAALHNTSYEGVSPKAMLEAAKLQLFGRQHIEETFEAVRKALLAAETPPDEPRQPPPPAV